MTNEELLQLIEQAARDKLTALNLNGKRLTSLPPQIARLSNLKELYLFNNKLTTLPPEIGQLSRLTTLDLSLNSFTVLPTVIIQLSNLTRLGLRNNQLSKLSPEIVQLFKLRTLTLHGNELTVIPSEIGQLANLKILFFGGNKLTTLPPEIGQLSKLTTLDLSVNQLTILPSEIGRLSNLDTLFLSYNQFTILPPIIWQLIRLRTLTLRGNKLTFLPPQINQLTRLKELDLRDNSLPIRPEILNKIGKPAAIITYYLQYQASQRRLLNEVKLLLVGQGSVGKTSLVRRLVEGYYDPHQNKTEGIEIKQWQIIVNDQKIRLNVWDFGGQEIMHATHQFFLTKRSLYLLVLDARLSEEENRLEYWLKMIQSFGGESPVIIVGNKIDQQPLDLDRRGLMLKYPQIRAIVETSCLDGHGLANLKVAIEREVGNLPHLNDQLLLSWFSVKTQLEQMDRDYLPYHEYIQICQVEGVNDELSQRTLMGFLHDLGVVLNFQDDPRLEETNILNPDWVTQGVYKILNDEILLTEHHGVLERIMLNNILDSHRYPRNKHLFIMDMMRKFELCFNFEGFADRKFLIPDLLPKEEPETGDWSNTLSFQYHYVILPGSVISRFIVRMNYLIHRQTYWRNGVVLAHEGNTALVKADREDKKIFIWVGGPEAGRRRFLAIIRAQFDSIYRTIPGLEVEEKVPLPDHPAIVVDYQYLRDLEEMGETHFVPPGLRQRVSVKKLLDGIEPEAYRRSGLGRESRREELQHLIRNSQRRLQKLKEEEALKGKSASLSLEIEDIESGIEKLQTELKVIE
jgi:internalin A